MTRFVVLAVPRTGSNLLCTLLDSHPEIVCHHEVFNPRGIFLAVSQRDRAETLGSIEDRDRDPLGFLERVWQTGQGEGFVGFKWTRGQNPLVLRQVVEDPGVKKIVLGRRGRIKTYVSEQIAKVTDQWEVYQASELISPRPRVVVGRAELLAHVAMNERFYGDLELLLKQSSQPFIKLYYEDLFCGEEQQRLLAFLGVAAVDIRLSEGSIKQNPTNLQYSIANFSELEASLQESDLLAELYECEN